MQNKDRYKEAINRNLYEVAYALMDKKILDVLDDYIQREGILYEGECFFSICQRSLSYDMVACLTKLLVDNNQSATFWYIFKTNQKNIKKLSTYCPNKINLLKMISTKLKKIREKALFHLDKEDVKEPWKVWERADIKRVEFNEALEFLHALLRELFECVLDKPFMYRIEDYSGEDLKKILQLAKSNKLI